MFQLKHGLIYTKGTKQMLFKDKIQIPAKEDALPGRKEEIDPGQFHFVNSNPLKGPYPKGSQIVYFALGCYWGAEKAFWEQDGGWVTAVGNISGFTQNPTYAEVCTGQTGHAEAVMVVYEPEKVSFNELLKLFWQSHNPTHGMRQGHDVGSQYRSAICWTTPAQENEAIQSRERYQKALHDRGIGEITTEITPAQTFYFAEDYHQQYLAKNLDGYCGLGGTGIDLPDA